MKRNRGEMSGEGGKGGAPPVKRAGGATYGKGLEIVFRDGTGAIPYEDERQVRWGSKGDGSRGGFRGGSRGGFGGGMAAGGGGGFEPCWICGSTEHKRKFCPHKVEYEEGRQVQKKMICLGCRRRGHLLSECPDRTGGASSLGGAEKPVCFNCGSDAHRLHECEEPMRGGGATFATCFICNAKGHLSRNCPSNKHGLYPRGGECKSCGGNDHLVKDCPKNKASEAAAASGVDAESEGDDTGSKVVPESKRARADPAGVDAAATSATNPVAASAGSSKREAKVSKGDARKSSGTGGDDLDSNVAVELADEEKCGGGSGAASKKAFYLKSKPKGRK